MAAPLLTLLGFLCGWVLVTLLYTAAVTIQASQFIIGSIPFVGIITGGYIAVIGIPAYLISQGIGLRGKLSYPMLGLVASCPMLVLSIYNGSALLIGTTIAAGTGFGVVFGYVVRKGWTNQRLSAN